MERAILDTDTFSEILKSKNQNVVRKASEYRNQFGRYTVSALTVAEMVKGFQKKVREDRIQILIANLTTEEILSFDRDAALIAGRIYGELERIGQPIGRADPLIASIAIHHQLVLVTGNVNHFERIVALGFHYH